MPSLARADRVAVEATLATLFGLIGTARGELTVQAMMDLP